MGILKDSKGNDKLTCKTTSHAASVTDESHPA